jgi:hypothetical protein
VDFFVRWEFYLGKYGTNPMIILYNFLLPTEAGSLMADKFNISFLIARPLVIPETKKRQGFGI